MRTLLLLMMISTAAAEQKTFVIPFAQPEQLTNTFDNIGGEIIRETSHFQIYAEHAFVPVDVDWLQTEVETIYAYLNERFGVETTQRFALTFRPPDTAQCPIRGLAMSDDAVAQAMVFADAQTGRAQVSGVLAHEIGHLFHARVLRAGGSDQNLTEGLATWAAGK